MRKHKGNHSRVKFGPRKPLKFLRTHRKFAFIAAFVFLSLVAVVTYTLLGSPHRRASGSSLAFTQANSSLLEHSLMSKNKETQASSLVPELRSAYINSKQTMFPTGSIVTIEPSTFKSSKDAAQVSATLSGRGKYILHLVNMNGSWLLLYTESQHG
jgi:hypothetical protein